MHKCVLTVIALICIFWAIIIILKFSKKQRVQNCIPKVEHELNLQKKQAADTPPEIKRIHDLLYSYQQTQNPMVLIEIGDIYQKGAFPRFKANPEKAARFYNIAAYNANQNVAVIANAKIIEARNEPINEADNFGEEMTDFHLDAFQVATIIDNRNQIVQIDEPTERFLNDHQNVHDHYMNKITQKNIDKLKEMHTYNNEDIVAILIDKLYGINDITNENKAKIIRVINSLSDKHPQYNSNELEIAFLIYSHVKNKPDLLRNLYLQLEDCFSNGHVVCGTGKISRMVAVVGDTEDFTDSKNIYYIKDELESLASKTRDEYLKTLSKQQVDAYNLGENDGITEELKMKYMETVREEYCNKLNIDYEILHPHVEINMSAF